MSYGAQWGDLLAALFELRRVLKPRGVLLLTLRLAHARSCAAKDMGPRGALHREDHLVQVCVRTGLVHIA